MKKYFLFVFSILLLTTACEKSHDLVASDSFQKQKSELVRDWIQLQLRLIKNTTGVTHVAYTRHFAYTGIALYETVVLGEGQYKSVAGTLSGTLQIPAPPAGKPLYWPAAANAAIADMMRYFYAAKPENLQRIDSLEAVYADKYAGEVNPAVDLAAATAFGKSMAEAVIAYSEQDGSDNANIPYTLQGEGHWEPTPPAFAPANVPGWGNNRTLLPNSITNTVPSAPTAFSVQPGSAFHNMAKELYDISQTLTPEQKAIAHFWDDAPNGKYVTAFGHWFSILAQVLEKDNPALITAADAYLRLGISMHDAIISCWQTKYTYHLLRPVTYIRKHMGYPDWSPIISTPPHPEYSAAHGTLSAAAGYALESVFGPDYPFTDHTYDVLGMSPRSYDSFEAAGREAGLSRLYGGIHYRPSIDTGNVQGKKVGANVKAQLKTRK